MNLLSRFPEKHRDIIIERYGFEDGIFKTLKEVGKKFQMSGEWVRKIEEGVIEEIRDILLSNTNITKHIYPIQLAYDEYNYNELKEKQFCFDIKRRIYKVYLYKLNNPADVKIEAITSDSQATYKIEKPKTIVLGENIYKIIVKSENGEENTYTLKVYNIDQEISKKLVIEKEHYGN